MQTTKQLVEPKAICTRKITLFNYLGLLVNKFNQIIRSKIRLKLINRSKDESEIDDLLNFKPKKVINFHYCSS